MHIDVLIGRFIGKSTEFVFETDTGGFSFIEMHNPEVVCIKNGVAHIQDKANKEQFLSLPLRGINRLSENKGIYTFIIHYSNHSKVYIKLKK